MCTNLKQYIIEYVECTLSIGTDFNFDINTLFEFQGSQLVKDHPQKCLISIQLDSHTFKQCFLTSFKEGDEGSKPVISINASVASFLDKCDEELTSTYIVEQISN